MKWRFKPEFVDKSQNHEPAAVLLSLSEVVVGWAAAGTNGSLPYCFAGDCSISHYL
jgi:hypothetical protein